MDRRYKHSMRSSTGKIYIVYKEVYIKIKIPEAHSKTEIV